MTPTKKNLAANFTSNAWMAALALVMVPVYHRMLGEDAFGIAALAMLLAPLLWQLDLGLGATVNRELARMSADPSQGRRMRDVLRTSETIYWMLSLLLAAAMIAFASQIASGWIKPKTISKDSVEMAVRLMGLALAAQWPLSLYSNGLLGVHRIVLLGWINVVFTTIKHGGAIATLVYVNPTIEAFMLWQVIASAAHTAALCVSLWVVMPRAEGRASFSRQIIIDIRRFAAEFWIIAAIGAVLGNLDKLLLSNTKILPWESFSDYSLAAIGAMSIAGIFSPVAAAMYPRFSRLHAENKLTELSEVYHAACQLVSVLVFSVAAVLAIFPEIAIFAWRGDAAVAGRIAMIFTVLVVGVAINGMMQMPFYMQLAWGWTRLALGINIVALVIVVPLLLTLTNLFAAIGAAAAYLILNVGYFLVTIPLMHRRLLTGQAMKWYFVDVFGPLAPIAAICLAVKFLLHFELSRIGSIIFLFVLGGACLVVGLLASPAIRHWMFERIRAMRQPSPAGESKDQ